MPSIWPFFKKSWFSTIFFDNFFYQKIYKNGHIEGNAYGELFFFQKFWKNFILGLKKHSLDVSWSSSGLFSNQQVFCHIDFILINMHPCALFFAKICFRILLATFFYKLFLQKNNFEWSSWRLRLWRNIIFLEIPKKNWDRALKNIVPDVSWSSSGLFSNKQVFCHIDFILSSMHPCAL